MSTGFGSGGAATMGIVRKSMQGDYRIREYLKSRRGSGTDWGLAYVCAIRLIFLLHYIRLAFKEKVKIPTPHVMFAKHDI